MKWNDIIENHKLDLYEACFEAKHNAITDKSDYYVMIYNDGSVSVKDKIDIESYDDGSAKLIYEASKDTPEIDNVETMEELGDVCMEQNDYFNEIINKAIDDCKVKGE